MDYTHLLSLANPVLGLLLSAMFLALWRWQRNRLSILNWSIAYAAGAVGFLVDYARFAYSNEWTISATVLLLGVVPALTARGVILANRERAPDVLLTAVYTLCMSFSIAFVFVWPHPILRGLLNNWHAAVLAAIALFHVVGLRSDMIDRLIQVTLGIMAITFFARPLLIFGYEGSPTQDVILNSLWLNSFKITSGAIWTVLAVLFTIRIVKDLVTTLQRDATTDPLTRLPNRLGFSTQAQRLQHLGPMCVAIIDLDHFKNVNDTFGHGAGDEVLTKFASVLRNSQREQDVTGRFGGEEFAMLLPGLPISVARLQMERIRSVCAQMQFVNVSPSLRVTASIGVVERRPDESLEHALARADQLLYQAKSRGRDRVVAERPSEPATGVMAEPGTDKRESTTLHQRATA
jgi:diguanylate cyclase (GGDEF)-like protein